MKKILFILVAVLMSTAVLAGCDNLSMASGDLSTEQGGEPSVSESAAESERSEPSQEESSQENPLPPVEGPDEEGKFPAISRDFYNEYIENSYGLDERDRPERPNDTDIIPFLEDVQAQAYLKSKFPGINDWKVLLEQHEYDWISYTYYPYSYSYGYGYLPHYVVMLATEQGGSFDRVLITGYEEILLDYDGLKDVYVPAWTGNFKSIKTTEKYLQCGDFSGAKVVYGSMYSNPNIWVPEASTMIYTSYDQLLRVTVEGAVEPFVISKANESKYWFFAEGSKRVTPPESRSGDMILTLDNGNGENILAYYDLSERSMRNFENVQYTFYCSYDFVTDTLMEYMDKETSAYYFYDFSDGADPTKCIFSLRGNGGELAGGAFNENRVYSATADRDMGDRYMLIYADNEAEKFYIVYFSFADGILTQITLDESPEGYIGDYSVRGGIAYISYNGGEGFEHYAVDLRPGKDHTLQANAW